MDLWNVALSYVSDLFSKISKSTNNYYHEGLLCSLIQSILDKTYFVYEDMFAFEGKLSFWLRIFPKSDF